MENLSAVMVFSSAILFFPVSLIVSVGIFSVLVSTSQTEKVCWSQDGGIRGRFCLLVCDHTGNSMMHPQEWWRLSRKEHNRNFAQIFILPKSVVIMDLIDYMFTFSLLAIMFSVNQRSPVRKLCTLYHSVLEVVFGWPLWGSTSTSCLSPWKLLNYQNVCAGTASSP
jgi:hypothetical protein